MDSRLSGMRRIYQHALCCLLLIVLVNNLAAGRIYQHALCCLFLINL